MSGRRIAWEQVRRQLAENERAMRQALDIAPEAARAILRRRAERLAARADGNAVAQPSVEVLTFQVGDERMGLELEALAEVVRLGSYTPIPGAPPELLGVVNLRGDIRPVIDLARAMGHDEAVDGGYVLFVRFEGREFGIRVGAVGAVRSIPLDSLRLPGELQAALPTRFAKGLTSDTLTVLDVEAVRDLIAAFAEIGAAPA